MRAYTTLVDSVACCFVSLERLLASDPFRIAVEFDCRSRYRVSGATYADDFSA